MRLATNNTHYTNGGNSCYSCNSWLISYEPLSQRTINHFPRSAIRDWPLADSAPDRFPDGEIVGQSDALGHILREGRNFEVPADNWRNVKVAIVGGGVAGLSAAWKLRKLGVEDLVVLELEKETGGTSIERFGAAGWLSLGRPLSAGAVSRECGTDRAA